MIRLDAATFLLQWATGGLLFLWVTTRGREVGIGYGWLMRGVFGVMALGALAAGRAIASVMPAAHDLRYGGRLLEAETPQRLKRAGIVLDAGEDQIPAGGIGGGDATGR